MLWNVFFSLDCYLTVFCQLKMAQWLKALGYWLEDWGFKLHQAAALEQALNIKEINVENATKCNKSSLKPLLVKCFSLTCLDNIVEWLCATVKQMSMVLLHHVWEVSFFPKKKKFSRAINSKFHLVKGFPRIQR